MKLFFSMAVFKIINTTGKEVLKLIREIYIYIQTGQTLSAEDDLIRPKVSEQLDLTYFFSALNVLLR